MTSPVEGLIVGKDLPEVASTHLLLMRSLVALTFTVGSITAVAMRGLLRKCRVGQPLATNARGKREKVTPAKGSRQGCRKPVSFRDPLIRLDLQRADVRNAGAHKVEVHFDEVVLDAAGLGSGEDFFPVERILTNRGVGLLIEVPALDVQGDEAAGIFGEIFGGVVTFANR